MSSRARVAAGAASLFLLFGASAALYWPGLDGPPVWDDHEFVGGQAFLREPGNVLRPLSLDAFAKVLPVRGVGRPLWLSSVMSDPGTPGQGSRRHRLVNILWHAAGAWALMCLLLAMTQDLPASLAGALLFLAHPAHVETVLLTTYRADLMAFFFIAAAAWLLYESRRVEGGRFARAAAVVCVGLALLSKESAVVAPLLLFWFDEAKPGTWRKRAALALGGVFVLYLWFYAPRGGYSLTDRADPLTTVYRSAPGLFAATSAPLKPETAAAPPAEPLDPPPWTDGQGPALRVLSGLRAQGRAVANLVWPFRLAPDPAPRPARSLFDPAAWLSAAALAGLLFAAWRLRPSAPLAAAGLAWIPLSLLPYMGFIAVKNSLGDRYLLFGTAGAAMAVAAALARVPAPRRRLALAGALLLACVWGAAARARLPDYASDEAFFRATLARDPEAPRARLGLAFVLIDRHDPGAEAELRRAVAAWPGSRTARGSLGLYLESQGRGAEAADVYRDLLNTRPGDEAARAALARVCGASGDGRSGALVCKVEASR